MKRIENVNELFAGQLLHFEPKDEENVERNMVFDVEIVNVNEMRDPAVKYAVVGYYEDGTNTYDKWGDYVFLSDDTFNIWFKFYDVFDVTEECSGRKVNTI